MLLPITQRTDFGGAAFGIRHFEDLIVAAVPSGATDLPERRLQQEREAERARAAVDTIAPGAAAPAEPGSGLSQRMARWEPVARALGNSAQAIAGFLKSVGVPQAQAEDMARRVADAARERLTIDRRATQAQFEAGRLSLKLEDVHVGFRRSSGRPEIEIGKAEIAADVEIPGARREESGASLGDAEAEIGQRKVAFAYEGPGATSAYADRGATAVTFTVAAPLSSPTNAAPAVQGPVDVAI
ncbi:MAG: hypothetical protein FJX54_07040 [Alphaproteobacteria bacterium]|nr:hypothetical protein [Alphaproteobacteria bacterium]